MDYSSKIPENYTLLHQRRDWSFLYANQNWKSYLKIWNRETIQREYERIHFLLKTI